MSDQRQSDEYGRTHLSAATVMTVAEVARYLRLSEAKIYRTAKAGQIPVFRVGRAWRFKRDLIDEWIRRETERRQVTE